MNLIETNSLRANLPPVTPAHPADRGQTARPLGAVPTSVSGVRPDGRASAAAYALAMKTKSDSNLAMKTNSLAGSLTHLLATKSARLLALLFCIASFLSTPTAAAPVTNASVDLAVLILAADGHDNTLPAVRKALDFLGTPYVVYTATQTPGGLTTNLLFSGTHAFYSGVILTTGDLVYSPDGGATWASALSAAEWQTLASYQADFGVRQVTWYTYPTANYGFGPATAIDTSASPLSVNFTAAGRTVFSYVNTANALQVKMAWTYLAPPLDTNTTALLSDAQGNALAAVKTFPDGRQNLALTFDSNEYLTHNWVLAYGLVNWVNKGLFLGERRAWVGAQVDDLFIDDDIFRATVYRVTGTDMQAVLNWQRAKQARPVTKSLKLDLAFNGVGTTGIYPNDTLTPWARANQSAFKWINHTFDHENLDRVDYVFAKAQITNNNAVAVSLGLTAFSKKNMVCPDVSGLVNLNFLNAAYDTGIRYLVSDTSIPAYNNPSPNAGLTNLLKPGIFMIPRHPNNLFYNVSTPSEWAAEYNFLYRTYWGRDLSYAEILDNQSEALLGYLLKGDMDPWMFHQSNLRAYDGVHTLLGDLLDATFAKYEALFNLPLLSPTMDVLGAKMANRTAYNVAGVRATRNPNNTVTLRATKAATFPVTGLKTTGSELYGGQYIKTVTLGAGQSVTITLQ